ncbi:MAG: TonB family protein [Bdellovibrionales bacterium]|nr:TonB family protein [Bdellovibrionales bacterium]
MSSLRYSPYDSNFSRPLWTSIFIHFLFVLFFNVRSYWIGNEGLELQQSLKVDLVGLPEKVNKIDPENLTPPKEANQKKIESTHVPPPEPEVQIKESKSEKIKNQYDIERKKALSAIDKIKNELQNNTSDNSKPEPSSNVKGNHLSKGNSLTGLTQLEYNRYLSILEKKVKQNWNLPSWLSNSALKAQVLVFVDSSGVILEKKISVSSGNRDFDDYALRAVEESGPFPPPGDLSQLLANKGVVFKFPD